MTKTFPKANTIGPYELPVLQLLAEHAQNASDLLAGSRNMRSGDVLAEFRQNSHHLHDHHHHRHHQQAFLTTESALVLLLYISLVGEIIAIVRGHYCRVKNRNSTRKSRVFRHAIFNVGNRSRGMYYHEKKNIRSLDNLWRRMQKATNQMRLVNLRHHVITKFMMEARMAAREREREKMHQKKEKMFAGILMPLGKTVRRVGMSFDRD